MTLESLQNYLGAALPVVLGPRQSFRLLGVVFALVAAAALLIHLLTEQESGVMPALSHALIIALTYVAAVGLAILLLRALDASHQVVRVWHIWLGSLACFLTGYYLAPAADGFPDSFALAHGHHSSQLTLAQLVPVWALLTYLFVQPYLHKALRLELAHLQEVNRLLEQHRRDSGPGTGEDIHFQAGRTHFTLASDEIRNIVVEDHYCYIYYRDGDHYSKRDLAMSLRDVSALLPPDNFLQVHRSHIVNLSAIESVNRRAREIRVVLTEGFEIPVSRHRLDEVLPRILARLE